MLSAVISRWILSLDYQFNWIDNILPLNKSLIVKSFLKRTIKILSRIREFNIIMIILVLIFFSLFIIYYSFLFIVYLEEICKLYLELKSKNK